jgi:hypothetical protein
MAPRPCDRARLIAQCPEGDVEQVRNLRLTLINEGQSCLPHIPSPDGKAQWQLAFLFFGVTTFTFP